MAAVATGAPSPGGGKKPPAAADRDVEKGHHHHHVPFTLKQEQQEPLMQRQSDPVPEEPPPRTRSQQSGSQERERRRSTPSPSRGRPRPNEQTPMVNLCCPYGTPFCCFMCQTSRFQEVWDSISNVMATGRVVTGACIGIFLIAWCVFIVAAVWSEDYYQEHLRPLDTLPPGPTETTAAWTRPPPGSETARRHFPMQAGHWVPGLLGTCAYVLMAGYSYSDGPANQASQARACFKDFLLISCGICVLLSFAVAFYYFISLVTIVPLYGQSYLIVPDVCVLIETFILFVGVGVGFLAKWLYYQKDNERRPNDPEDED